MRYDPRGDARACVDLASIAQSVREYFADDARLDSATVSLSFVSDDEIRELNARYREVDEPTDVLSFPLWETDGEFCPPDGWDELPLGDVVIAPEFVRTQAEEAGRTADADTALMIVHGTLHLLGFDHADDAGRERMWAAQDAILEVYVKHLRGAEIL